GSRRLLRGSAGVDGPLQRDSRGKDLADQQSDSDRKEPRNDLHGSVPDRARSKQHRSSRRGARSRARPRNVQDDVGRSSGRPAGPSRAAPVSDPCPDGPANDSRKVKRAPPPGRAFTSTVPPCNSAIRLTIANPKPAPTGLVE